MTFFWNVTPFALVSDCANRIVICTIAFLRFRQLNKGKHDFFGYVIPLALSPVSHDADNTVNGTTALIRLK